MATAYSTLLGLALPVQGELSGTWGDTVNNYITAYLDAAVAGAQTLSTDADVTLTKTTNAALNGTSSQYAIINCTGARTVLRTITAPAASKIYVVINQTTGGFGVKLVGAGPTTGVTIAAGTKALVAWNGTDFALFSTTDASGLVPVLNGGTGVTTAQAEMNRVAAAVTSGSYLRGNGTNVVMSTIQAGDVPTLNQSTTGSAGSVANALTVGTGLALSSGTTYNGSSALTINAVGTTLNSQTGAYVLVAADAGKMISITTGGVTVNNSVFSAGHIVTIYNNSGSSQTITQGTGVTLQWAGQTASTTGTRTLGLYGIATIVFLSASSVVITGSGLT